MKVIAVSGSGREIARRRSYRKEFRHQVVKETLSAGSSVSAVALKHQINTNLLFNWRRKYLRELAGAPTSKLLPVKIEETRAALAQTPALALALPLRFFTNLGLPNLALR